MKTVYTTREIPHLWASRSLDGHDIRNATRNHYTAGNVLYSYAEPIAAWHARAEANPHVLWLFRNQRFSRTTGRHIDRAREAVRPFGHFGGQPVCYVPVVNPIGEHEHQRNIRAMLESASIAAARSKRARSPGHRQSYADDAARSLASLETYVAWYDLPDYLPTPPVEGVSVVEGIAASLESINATLAAGRAQRLEEERVRQLTAARDARFRLYDRVRAWEQGDDVSVYPHPETLLRLMIDGSGEPDTVETSKGAVVPAVQARELLDVWLRDPASVSGCRLARAYDVSPETTADALVIGCHRLTRFVVLRFALAQGWITREVYDAEQVAAPEGFYGMEMEEAATT